MKKRYFSLVFLIFILLLALFLLRRSDEVEINDQENIRGSQGAQVENSNYQTKEDSEGEVLIEVTPIKLSLGNEMVFQVAINTHSVPLEYDFKEASVLTDSNGKEYKPVSWSGGEGGHHLDGELIFPVISENATSVTLTMKGIENIDRTFTWDIK